MKIYVKGAIGKGPTTLAAFDSALVQTGTANFNLVRLSSVIPPKSEVVVTDEIPELPGEWGDRLYLVYAEMRTEVRNEEAWAGIGWVLDPETGKGLFVEHEGRSEQKVRQDITDSLKGLLVNRNMPELPIEMHVVGAKCENDPICAFVSAAYQVSNWDNERIAVRKSLGEKLAGTLLPKRKENLPGTENGQQG
jgi:arginine decarboxylase